jgi:hypothetical protein
MIWKGLELITHQNIILKMFCMFKQKNITALKEDLNPWCYNTKLQQNHSTDFS